MRVVFLSWSAFTADSARPSLAQSVPHDAPVFSIGPEAAEAPAPISDRPVFPADLASAATSEGVSLLEELEADASSLARRPDFYALLGGLVLAPRFLDKESTSLNSRLVGSAEADRFFEVGETLGNSLVPIGFSLALYAAGKTKGSSELTQVGSDLLRAQILSGVLTAAIKIGTNRARPDGTDYAFPSGHTSSAFAAAGVIGKHYGWKWGALAEAAAVYVGLSRLQENKHFVSDVIAGAVIGTYIAYRVTERSEKEPRAVITPILGARTYGLSLSARF